ncbi:general odorant-binding protein 19a-like [Microplitis mediator]|uniref:general odorant-binding protein 19a-like n=1 Tax=Microplitis mediator TaxID=375433 RepID=UPI0025572CC0|nr:general odorant-binding protein 19a-like [Microplitis mediator]XP_057328930.1 general odorant-binding protein 19a-like [Microplitis mediator]
MKNKFISTLAVVFFVTINFSRTEARLNVEQMKEFGKAIAKSCASKTALSKELQEAHRNGEFPEDEALKCYLGCYCKMSKIFDKDNNIDLSYVFKQLDAMVELQYIDRMKNVFTTCKAQMTATELCQLGYDYAKCYRNMDAGVYTFI